MMGRRRRRKKKKKEEEEKEEEEEEEKKKKKEKTEGSYGFSVSGLNFRICKEVSSRRVDFSSGSSVILIRSLLSTSQTTSLKICQAKWTHKSIPALHLLFIRSQSRILKIPSVNLGLFLDYRLIRLINPARNESQWCLHLSRFFKKLLRFSQLFRDSAKEFCSVIIRFVSFKNRNK